MNRTRTNCELTHARCNYLTVNKPCIHFEQMSLHVTFSAVWSWSVGQTACLTRWTLVYITIFSPSHGYWLTMPVSSGVYRFNDDIDINIPRSAWQSGTNMLYIDRAIGQFWKQSASIIPVKVGHVEHLNTVFNMTNLHCNDKGQSFAELFDYLIYAKHACSTCLCASLYDIHTTEHVQKLPSQCIASETSRHWRHLASTSEQVSSTCQSQYSNNTRDTFTLQSTSTRTRRLQQSPNTAFCKPCRKKI